MTVSDVCVASLQAAIVAGQVASWPAAFGRWSTAAAQAWVGAWSQVPLESSIINALSKFWISELLLSLSTLLMLHLLCSEWDWPSPNLFFIIFGIIFILRGIMLWIKLLFFIMSIICYDVCICTLIIICSLMVINSWIQVNFFVSSPLLNSLSLPDFHYLIWFQG